MRILRSNSQIRRNPAFRHPQSPGRLPHLPPLLNLARDHPHLGHQAVPTRLVCVSDVAAAADQGRRDAVFEGQVEVGQRALVARHGARWVLSLLCPPLSLDSFVAVATAVQVSRSSGCFTFGNSRWDVRNRAKCQVVSELGRSSCLLCALQSVLVQQSSPDRLRVSCYATSDFLIALCTTFGRKSLVRVWSEPALPFGSKGTSSSRLPGLRIRTISGV